MSLLPVNAGVAERAIAAATSLTLPTPIPDLWNPEKCPAVALPWLAWALHVDNWEIAETDEQKRAAIRSSVAVHRKKGTPWSIREVVRRLGFGEVELIEHIGRLSYDGVRRYDGQMIYGDPNAWPIYRIVMLDRALTNEQAARLRIALVDFAPARCHLAGLDYQSVPIRYNAAASYSGQYNHGSA